MSFSCKINSALVSVFLYKLGTKRVIGGISGIIFMKSPLQRCCDPPFRSVSVNKT